MNLFDLLNPKMFRPLAGRNQRIYTDLLMLIWDRCGTSQDYSIGKSALTELTETYMEGLGTLLPPDEEDEWDGATSDARSQGLLFLRRLRDTGWLEDLEGGYEEETRTALCAPAVRLLQLFDELLHPKTVTYSGKLLKAYRLLQNLEQEKSPYENVLKEVSADMADLNSSLRQLNASIGTYIDQLTRNRTPQEVLDLFQQYEDEIVVAAYHRFKTSDNLFQYRTGIMEGLDTCDGRYAEALVADYCRVERVSEAEGTIAVRRLVQKVRDELDIMRDLLAEIDRNHVTYRKRAVQRAQFMLLSDGSAQGKISDLLRYYAQTIQRPEELFEPDESPLSRHWKFYPTEILDRNFLKPAINSRTPTPIEQSPPEPPISEEELQRQQELLLEYVRQAVTLENVNRFASQVLEHRETVSALELASVQSQEFIKIIGLHTYSQSPDRNYEISEQEEWVSCGGFRFQQFWIRMRS
ncbi:Wadjet anti-phage system protein JetA family protein [Pseudoflavonifractor sp. MCC625]|uniref:Wadjet anti-phage system protein JetA family protein n=1 Tax=Pseudoflavonifractor sp. MCC625 TaxID=2592647 RepID=UPI001C025751|nr:Wadjet anti-phage system protein JetA family protein [Pseudoflavonifractor sp. MCC625]MBT9683124.1 hypothetical protein [Pseudoflavonifractor sp. MCC625]